MPVAERDSRFHASIVVVAAPPLAALCPLDLCIGRSIFECTDRRAWQGSLKTRDGRWSCAEPRRPAASRQVSQIFNYKSSGQSAARGGAATTTTLAWKRESLSATGIAPTSCRVGGDHGLARCWGAGLLSGARALTDRVRESSHGPSEAREARRAVAAHADPLSHYIGLCTLWGRPGWEPTGGWAAVCSDTRRYRLGHRAFLAYQLSA
jgi:hypothetical protein